MVARLKLKGIDGRMKSINTTKTNSPLRMCIDLTRNIVHLLLYVIKNSYCFTYSWETIEEDFYCTAVSIKCQISRKSYNKNSYNNNYCAVDTYMHGS